MNQQHVQAAPKHTTVKFEALAENEYGTPLFIYF
jgi:hypothetical protein